MRHHNELLRAGECKLPPVHFLNLDSDCLGRIARLYIDSFASLPNESKRHISANAMHSSARERHAARLAAVSWQLRRTISDCIIPELRLEALHEVSSAADALHSLNVHTALSYAES